MRNKRVPQATPAQVNRAARLAIVAVIACASVTSCTEQQLGCEGESASGWKHVNDSSLCPAFVSLASNTSRGTSNYSSPFLNHLIYCEGDGEVEAVGFRVPTDRMQALLVVQSFDGLFRKVSFEPESRNCRQCTHCHSPDDVAPTCEASGCPGCSVSGVLRISAEMLPAVTTAGTKLEVLLLCAVSRSEAGTSERLVTQVALPLLVQGKRDACNVCGGDNTTCTGCDGISGSGMRYDMCGQCRRPGSGTWNACVGCDHVGYSGKVEDACGVCGGDNSSCVDCRGVPHGTLERDSCGVCGGSDWSCDDSFSLSFVFGVRRGSADSGAASSLNPTANESDGQAADWWSRGPHVCAGDAVGLRWRAPPPEGAGSEDRIALFFPAQFGRTPVSPDQLVLPRSTPAPTASATASIYTGTVSFKTQRGWWLPVSGDGGGGGHMYAEYFTHAPTKSHAQYAVGEAEVVSDVIAVAPPADVCGICGGDGTSCAGCDGEAYSGTVLDACGVCGGNDECLDCLGTPWGKFRLDRCGECRVPYLVCGQGQFEGMACSRDSDCVKSTQGGAAAGEGKWGESCNASRLRHGSWNECVDCAGVVHGTADRDSCGNCGGSDDSCARGFSITSAELAVCLGEEIRALWHGPSNRQRSTYVGIARITTDGSAGPIFSWAPVDPNVMDLQWGGGVLGQSELVPKDDVRSGFVLFNRTCMSQQPLSCEAGRRGDGEGDESQMSNACLIGTQYLLPSTQGRFRFQVLASADSAQISAQSEPFTILPPADPCGVCGGDGLTCAGCDLVPNSGVAKDECGVCGGLNACLGCDLVPFSGKTLDACAVCDGDGTSCVGCDGNQTPPPLVPASYDGCGECGGRDDSCVLPHAIGLLPAYPGNRSCAGASIEIWWRAPANRSSGDAVAVCPHRSAELPGTYRQSCVVVVHISDTPSGPLGSVSVDLSGSFSAPGHYELLYLVADGSSDITEHSVGAVHEFESTNDSRECLKSGVRIEAERRELCLGQDIRLVVKFPATIENRDRSSALVGILSAPPDAGWGANVVRATGGPPAFQVAGRSPCAPPCSRNGATGVVGGAGHECGSCFAQVCVLRGGDGQDPGCAGSDHHVVLPVSGGDDTLAAPDEEGVYIACLYADHNAFFSRDPLTCSQPFAVMVAEYDVCGVCGGSGNTCLGCDGKPNSGLELDSCSECGGDNSTCSGCDGFPYSGLELDACNVCGGDNSTCAGCDGLPNSGAKYDSCGVCGGSDSHCNDPYALEVWPMCAPETHFVQVQWRAPSNHSVLQMRLLGPTDELCDVWESSQVVSGALQEYAEFEAGDPGCAPSCNTGTARIRPNRDALTECSSPTYYEASNTPRGGRKEGYNWGRDMGGRGHNVREDSEAERQGSPASWQGKWWKRRRLSLTFPTSSWKLQLVASVTPQETEVVYSLVLEHLRPEVKFSGCSGGWMGVASIHKCPCGAGYKGSDGGPCDACEAGKFKAAAGSGGCLDCPIHSTSQPASNTCICKPGYWEDKVLKTCLECEAGTYKKVSGNEECTNCPGNTTSPPASVESSGCLCNSGYAGANAANCMACAAGTYKQGTGSGACTKCQQGKFSSALAAISCRSCPDHSDSPAGSDNVKNCSCAPGYSGPHGGLCIECAAGKFKAVRGNASCLPCPDKTTSWEASKDCSAYVTVWWLQWEVIIGAGVTAMVVLGLGVLVWVVVCRARRKRLAENKEFSEKDKFESVAGIGGSSPKKDNPPSDVVVFDEYGRMVIKGEQDAGASPSKDECVSSPKFPARPQQPAKSRQLKEQQEQEQHNSTFSLANTSPLGPARDITDGDQEVMELPANSGQNTDDFVKLDSNFADFGQFEKIENLKIEEPAWGVLRRGESVATGKVGTVRDDKSWVTSDTEDQFGEFCHPETKQSPSIEIFQDRFPSTRTQDGSLGILVPRIAAPSMSRGGSIRTEDGTKAKVDGNAALQSGHVGDPPRHFNDFGHTRTQDQTRSSPLNGFVGILSSPSPIQNESVGSNRIPRLAPPSPSTCRGDVSRAPNVGTSIFEGVATTGGELPRDFHDFGHVQTKDDINTIPSPNNSFVRDLSPSSPKQNGSVGSIHVPRLAPPRTSTARGNVTQAETVLSSKVEGTAAPPHIGQAGVQGQDLFQMNMLPDHAQSLSYPKASASLPSAPPANFSTTSPSPILRVGEVPLLSANPLASPASAAGASKNFVQVGNPWGSSPKQLGPPAANFSTTSSILRVGEDPLLSDNPLASDASAAGASKNFVQVGNPLGSSPKQNGPEGSGLIPLLAPPRTSAVRGNVNRSEGGGSATAEGIASSHHFSSVLEVCEDPLFPANRSTSSVSAQNSKSVVAGGNPWGSVAPVDTNSLFENHRNIVPATVCSVDPSEVQFVPTNPWASEGDAGFQTTDFGSTTKSEFGVMDWNFLANDFAPTSATDFPPTTSVSGAGTCTNPNCGATLLVDARFCTECGKRCKSRSPSPGRSPNSTSGAVSKQSTQNDSVNTRTQQRDNTVGGKKLPSSRTDPLAPYPAPAGAKEFATTIGELGNPSRSPNSKSAIFGIRWGKGDSSRVSGTGRMNSAGNLTNAKMVSGGNASGTVLNGNGRNGMSSFGSGHSWSANSVENSEHDLTLRGSTTSYSSVEKRARRGEFTKWNPLTPYPSPAGAVNLSASDGVTNASPMSATRKGGAIPGSGQMGIKLKGLVAGMANTLLHESDDRVRRSSTSTPDVGRPSTGSKVDSQNRARSGFSAGSGTGRSNAGGQPGTKIGAQEPNTLMSRFEGAFEGGGESPEEIGQGGNTTVSTPGTGGISITLPPRRGKDSASRGRYLGGLGVASGTGNRLSLPPPSPGTRPAATPKAQNMVEGVAMDSASDPAGNDLWDADFDGTWVGGQLLGMFSSSAPSPHTLSVSLSPIQPATSGRSDAGLGLDGVDLGLGLHFNGGVEGIQQSEELPWAEDGAGVFGGERKEGMELGTLKLTLGRGRGGKADGRRSVGMTARNSPHSKLNKSLKPALGGIARPTFGTPNSPTSPKLQFRTNEKEDEVKIEHDLDGRIVDRFKVWDDDGVIAHVLIASYHHLIGKEVEVTATFANTGSIPYSYFICRAAAPRYINVEMGASQGSKLSPHEGDILSWTIRMKNTKYPEKLLRLQLRVELQEVGSAQSRTISIPVPFKS